MPEMTSLLALLLSCAFGSGTTWLWLVSRHRVALGAAHAALASAQQQATAAEAEVIGLAARLDALNLLLQSKTADLARAQQTIHLHSDDIAALQSRIHQLESSNTELLAHHRSLEGQLAGARARAKRKELSSAKTPPPPSKFSASGPVRIFPKPQNHTDEPY